MHSTKLQRLCWSVMMLSSNGSLQNAAFDASDEHLQHLMAEAILVEK